MSIVGYVMSDTQTRETAHYASIFDAEYEAASEPVGTSANTGRHRANEAELVELELGEIRSRLDKLRQRMRSALSFGTVFGLGLAAVTLIGLAVSSLISFVGGDGGLGMLLCALFIVGVPLTAAAAVKAGRPWWQLGHEAALLRQREKELHAQWGRLVLSIEGARHMDTASSGTSTKNDDKNHRRSGWGTRNDMPDEVSALGFKPERSSSRYSSSSRNYSGSALDNEPLAEYSPLSPSSHVLARVMQDTLGRASTESARAAERTGTPVNDTGSESGGARSSSTGGLLAAWRPRKSRQPSTEPTWWSPTGLSERATQHLAPAEPEPRRIGGWGVLVVVGAFMTLFAIGLIAGVLTAA